MDINNLLELCTETVSFTDEEGFTYTLDQDERLELIHIIKQQIAEKPNTQKFVQVIDPLGSDEYEEITRVYRICPVCKEKIYQYVRKNNFCHNCGQKINWGDDKNGK